MYKNKSFEITADERETLLTIYEAVAEARGFVPDYEPKDRGLINFNHEDADLLDTVLYHVKNFGKDHPLFSSISNLFEDAPEIEEPKTRRFNVTIACQAVYNSSIQVPVDLSFEEALEYAQEHIRDIPLGALEYIPDSDELDVENCDFDDRDLEEGLENEPDQAKRSSLDQQIQGAFSRAAISQPSSYLKAKSEPEI